MFKRKQRLSRKDFENILKKGTRVQNEYLSLLHEDETETKVGVVVSKKNANKATQRNKLRRIIFSVLKDNERYLNKKHVAVFLKKNSSKMTFSEIERELTTLLKKHLK